MPFLIKKTTGNKWVVIKKTTGKKINKKFNSKHSATSTAKNWLRYRHETSKGKIFYK